MVVNIRMHRHHSRIYTHKHIGSAYLTHWGRDKMATRFNINAIFLVWGFVRLSLSKLSLISKRIPTLWDVIKIFTWNPSSRRPGSFCSHNSDSSEWHQMFFAVLFQEISQINLHIIQPRDPNEYMVCKIGHFIYTTVYKQCLPRHIYLISAVILTLMPMNVPNSHSWNIKT